MNGARLVKEIKKCIRFSISAKLTLIVAVLSFLFLPAIIMLAAWLTNTRDITQENNRAVNDWTAQAVKSELENVRSGVVSLLWKIDEAGGAGANEVGITERFFTLNPTIKAVCIFPKTSQTRHPVQAMVEISAVADPPEVQDTPEPRLFVNSTAKTIGRENITMWFENQKKTIRQTLPDGIMTYDAEAFFDPPLFVMIFPYKRGAEITTAAIFFSPENLVKSLGTGDDASFIINEGSDVLFQTEDGSNADDLSFIQWQTPERGSRSFTSVYSDDEGVEYFAAIKKIAVNQREAASENNLVVITTSKTARALEKIAAVVRLMCFIGGGALVLSLILVRLYAKTISKPLLALIHAADSVREGDYAVNLTNRSRDEIEELTQSFISMTRGVAYIEKFANKTALRLARQGTPIHTGNVVATVCFVKLRAFADLTGNLSVRDTAALVNEFFSCLTRCVTRKGGVVDKFLTYDGAALLAFWGALESGSPERDAMNCIYAALMMRTSLQKLNKERLLRAQGAQCVPLKISCVVNTGEALTGIINADERKELLVAGDAVNLAERIADANEGFDTDILIMEHTWELIGGQLVLEETPVIEVKGRKKPLRTFALLNVRSDDEVDAILREVEEPCRR
ncbi:MAG: HAMP domain-containing protein [Treponema sp.]|jgi:adenylate cyclase|nr:HAMP domain-containing protein [Treponema sp.]